MERFVKYFSAFGITSLENDINLYAQNNNLIILSMFSKDTMGIYVLFEKRR